MHQKFDILLLWILLRDDGEVETSEYSGEDERREEEEHLNEEKSLRTVRDRCGRGCWVGTVLEHLVGEFSCKISLIIISHGLSVYLSCSTPPTSDPSLGTTQPSI